MCQTLERSLPHIGQLRKLMIIYLLIWQKVKRHNWTNMRIVERATKMICKENLHKYENCWKYFPTKCENLIKLLVRTSLYIFWGVRFSWEGRMQKKLDWELCSFYTRLHHSIIIYGSKWPVKSCETRITNWVLHCTVLNAILYRKFTDLVGGAKQEVFRTTCQHIDYELHILPVSTFILLPC